MAFGSWLQSKHIEIGRNDRAALIRIGEHPVISAEVLGRTKLRSPELIWRREISKLIKKSPEPEQPETQPETEVTVTCPLSDHLIEPPPAAAPGTDFRTVSGTEQEDTRSQAMVQQARLTAEFRTMKRAAMAAEEAAERGRAPEHAARDAEAIEGVPELAADLRIDVGTRHPPALGPHPRIAGCDRRTATAASRHRGGRHPGCGRVSAGVGRLVNSK